MYAAKAGEAAVLSVVCIPVTGVEMLMTRLPFEKPGSLIESCRT